MSRKRKNARQNFVKRPNRTFQGSRPVSYPASIAIACNDNPR
jgi:hypothetical protein